MFYASAAEGVVPCGCVAGHWKLESVFRAFTIRRSAPSSVHCCATLIPLHRIASCVFRSIEIAEPKASQRLQIILRTFSTQRTLIFLLYYSYGGQ